MLTWKGGKKVLISHESPRIPPQELREAPTPTLEAVRGGQENSITALKLPKVRVVPNSPLTPLLGTSFTLKPLEL